MTHKSSSAYGPHKTLRALNFICNAPQAKSVSLVGDFNHWNPAAHPMKRGLRAPSPNLKDPRQAHQASRIAGERV